MAKIRICTNISNEQVTQTTGIGQVVLAQWKYLPEHGFELTTDPRAADVYASHIDKPSAWPRIDCVMLHGLYWQDIEHYPFQGWHNETNRRIIRSAREALVVTVPSEWVGQPFKRDMRITPVVVPHGVNLSEFKPGVSKGYALYNKNRESDVCHSRPAWELGQAGIPVISTFSPKGLPVPDIMKVTGLVPFDEMKQLLSEAEMYIATTIETFGIGTVEALASGVPVLGYRWGGTEDIIKHQENGYLVEPGDIQGLIEGAHYIRENRKAMGEAALASSKGYDWPKVIVRYARLFSAIAGYKPSNTAAIIITCHNYGRWVGEAIQSCVNQTRKPAEIIVVDDGSTDNSREVIRAQQAQVEAAGIIFKTIFQENQGVAAARNHGLAETGCDFVTCLDADDRIAPQFVEVLQNALISEHGLGIAYSGLTLMNEDGGNPIVTGWPPEFDWDIQSTPHVPPFNCIPSACMFRRSMWLRAGGYRQEYAPGEDTEFWTRGLSVGFNARRVTQDPLFQYRGHEGSASRTRKYIGIDDRMPWMRTGEFPMGAPAIKKAPIVRSNAQPVISVVIPVGPGHENYLYQALDSLISQTFYYWEAVVVNDTQQPLKLPPAYPFARVIDNPGPNHGAGAARNVGIKAAKAPLSFFLDADDLLAPDALEHILVLYQKNKGSRYVYTDWVVIRNGNPEPGQAKEYRQDEWKMFHPVSVLMATQCARDILFDETLPSWEDWDFMLKCAIRGVCGLRLPEPLLIYRLDSGQRRMKVLNPDGTLNARGEQVLGILGQRYEKYFSGGIAMAPCATCGGGTAADEILRAKGRYASQDMTESVPANEIPIQDPNPRVRLQYIGEHIAATSYTVNGHTYRAAKNQFEEYIDVVPEDVQHLINLGVFKVVSRPVLPTVSQSNDLHPTVTIPGET